MRTYRDQVLFVPAYLADPSHSWRTEETTIQKYAVVMQYGTLAETYCETQIANTTHSSLPLCNSRLCSRPGQHLVQFEYGKAF